MPAKITRYIIESYLNCKYKGHLKLVGEGGTPSDYEAMTAAISRASREEAVARLADADQPVEAEHDEIPDRGISVIDVIANKQTQEKVRRILEELPEKDRRIIKEVFIEERDKDEVCRDYGVDRDYLRVLLHRAKQSFKSHYLKNIAVVAGGAQNQRL